MTQNSGWAAVLAGTEERGVSRKQHTNKTEITIIDQGSFAFLEFEGLDASPDQPAAAGIHVLQILPTSLVSRATHFLPLTQPCRYRQLLACPLRLRITASDCMDEGLAAQCNYPQPLCQVQHLCNGL